MGYHVDMMKNAGILIILFIFSIFLPCSAETSTSATDDSAPSKIFTYHIPETITSSDAEETSEDKAKSNNEDKAEVKSDITSDDITADTSGEEIVEEEESDDEMDEPEIEEYQIGDMYSDVLKGYAQYDEGEEDAVLLSDTLDEFQTIKLTKPAKIGSQKYDPLMPETQNLYSSMSGLEYSIAPISGTSYAAKKGGFSAGTTYNQGIDYAELEQSTGVFSRYETKHFSISTSYARTINSTNNNYNDNVYLSPELIINQYFSLREVLSADIVKNRKTAEMIFSINPFGHKDTDRLRFELGASSVYDDKNALLKNQFKFSTKFQL